MAAAKHLYKLIHALTPAEKRYFQLHSQIHVIKKKNNYMKLYDYLVDLDVFDEEQIKNHCQKNNITKNFSAEKNYLYKKVLESMRQFHTIDVADQLKDLMFLYNKGLFHFFIKRYKVYYKSLLDSGDFIDRLKLLQFEKKMLFDGKQRILNKNIVDIYEEEAKLIDKLKINNRLSYIKLRILEYSKVCKNNPEHSFLEKLFNEAKDLIASIELTPSINREWLYINSYYYYTIKDYNNAFSYTQELISLLEEHPEWDINSGNDYRKPLSNYLNICIHLRNFKDFNIKLNKLKRIPSRTLLEEVEQFQHVSHLEIIYLLNVGDFTGLQNLTPQVEEGLEKYSNYININRTLSIKYNLMIANFITGNFSNAFPLSSDICLKRTNNRVDIQITTRVINFILHIELGNLSYLKYVNKNLQKYISSKYVIGDFENSLFKFLDILVLDCKSKQSFESVQEEIKYMKLINPNFTGIEELSMWIESKCTDKPMIDIYKQILSKTVNTNNYFS